MSHSFKDLANRKKSKDNAYQQEARSPTTIPDKYFRNNNSFKMLNKMRVPKTGNANKSMDAGMRNNFMNTNLLPEDISKKVDEFKKRFNFSFDSKQKGNSFKLEALKSKPSEKPPSRRPVFERLTSGLLKNNRNNSKKEKVTTKLEETKVLKNINKIHPLGRFGDTGSSFDQEITRQDSQNDAYGVIKKTNGSLYDVDPYDPKFLIKLQHRNKKKKNFLKQSQLLHSPATQNINNTTKLNLKEDVVLRYQVKSQVGKVQNKNKEANQDSYITQKMNNYWLFGVLDGHGLFGHHASSLVKRLLPRHIFKKKKVELSSIINNKKDLKKGNGLQNKDIITGFRRVHKHLEENKTTFDPSFSGTTVNLCMINSDERKLICANAGDSRSVMYSFQRARVNTDLDEVNILTPGRDESNDFEWDITPLSEDHKPDLPKEYERITQKYKGRVLSYQDDEGNPVGPARVWLREKNVPGLAMSRSIGDIVAHSVGVECSPEIKEFTLKPEDKILVIGSDGLWEFMDNKEVLDIILPFYKKDKTKPEKAIDKLIKKASQKWSKEENVVDDITIILVYLNIN
ncbi:unnamed protein product [Moneuplotes crassus]|uniref:PPM-type phosphatase domain-containing protein n=1 Tax=Euplotes crassus TaxID=5936 RepID=A0AAD1Y4B1_EUPCR|nr:unnamed protein product [Moneuplotes crassus]